MMATIAPTDLAKRWQDNPNLVVIDVRSPGEHRGVHATGATLAPLADLDPAGMAREHAGQAIYILCQSGARARTAADKLSAAGFDQAIVVEGGTQAWVSAGLPATHGKRGLDVMRQVQLVIGAGVLSGALLGRFVHPELIWISAFFGAGLLMAGLSGRCPLANGLAPMPWNRKPQADAPSCCAPIGGQ